MPITADALETALATFSAAAEKIFHAEGQVTPVAWLIPDAGVPMLVVKPDDVTGAGWIEEPARMLQPAAIVWCGEYWIGAASLPDQTAARLPREDLPRPSELPDRQEAIIIRGVGRAADGGLLRAARASLIVRTASDARLERLDALPDEGRSEDFSAFLQA
jgi:hypothetical protein